MTRLETKAKKLRMPLADGRYLTVYRHEVRRGRTFFSYSIRNRRRGRCIGDRFVVDIDGRARFDCNADQPNEFAFHISERIVVAVYGSRLNHLCAFIGIAHPLQGVPAK